MLYVGISGQKREKFVSKETPTSKSHAHLYDAVIGPFRTLRAANFMCEHPNNPHCRCVADAERLSVH